MRKFGDVVQENEGLKFELNYYANFIKTMRKMLGATANQDLQSLFTDFDSFTQNVKSKFVGPQLKDKNK
jgi:hypothetical protein